MNNIIPIPKPTVILNNLNSQNISKSNNVKILELKNDVIHENESNSINVNNANTLKLKNSVKHKNESNTINVNDANTPYIDVYIYDVASIKEPYGQDQDFFKIDAKQKFNNLYVNYETKGIIHPMEYYYYKNIKKQVYYQDNIINLNKINFDISQVYKDNRLYSSDILTSFNNDETEKQSGGTMNNLKDFYKFYKHHITKHLKFENYQVNPFYNEKRIKNIIKTIRKAIIQTKKIHTNDQQILSHRCDNCNAVKNNSKSETSLINIKYLNNILKKSHIFNITLNDDSKVVILGDFHGSFHAFFRIFLRLHYLNIINFENYIINDEYKIIFLGDIADRGQYALEIYYIICKFICKNNNDPNNLKIILNRGNHEEPSQWIQENTRGYGFTAEITKKIPALYYNKIISYMKKLLAYCSSGIVLTYSDETQTNRYWLSHGGIPLEQTVEDTYKIGNKRCISLNEYKVEHLEIGSRSTSSIRWADYITKKSGFTSYGGRGKIPTDLLYNFLNVNNIDFVIRGHNDDYENAYLLSNYYSYNTLPLNNITIHKENPDNKFIIFPKETFKNPKIKEVLQTNGYVARIKTNNWYEKNSQDKKFSVKIQKDSRDDKDVYPVLTISTNSDIARTLNKDSFVILNMNSNIISYTKNNILNKIKNNTPNTLCSTCRPKTSPSFYSRFSSFFW